MQFQIDRCQIYDSVLILWCRSLKFVDTLLSLRRNLMAREIILRGRREARKEKSQHYQINPLPNSPKT
jgi:hypothetical protein